MFDCVLTNGSNELVEAAKGEQRFWKFTQKKLQCSSDHMNLFPLSVFQVQLLLCKDDRNITHEEEKLAAVCRDQPSAALLSDLKHSLITYVNERSLPNYSGGVLTRILSFDESLKSDGDRLVTYCMY